MRLRQTFWETKTQQTHSVGHNKIATDDRIVYAKAMIRHRKIEREKKRQVFRVAVRCAHRRMSRLPPLNTIYIYIIMLWMETCFRHWSLLLLLGLAILSQPPPRKTSIHFSFGSADECAYVGCSAFVAFTLLSMACRHVGCCRWATESAPCPSARWHRRGSNRGRTCCFARHIHQSRDAVTEWGRALVWCNF